MTAAVIPAEATTADEIAARFVAARRERRGFAAYPGRQPTTMDEAYAIQEAAIARYGDRVVGWKVGMVPPNLQEMLGAHRIAGPIFAANVWPAEPEAALPLIPGGFAAVEGEFVARIGVNADPAKLDWTETEAVALLDAVFVGVEYAGSPLNDINSYGSAVVASDFGNNAGLVVGPEITDWQDRLADITVETRIDGQVVGTGKAASIPRGVMESVRFLVENLARRGRPVTRGVLISTGAVTGVHEIFAGQKAVCAFSGVGDIACSA